MKNENMETLEKNFNSIEEREIQEDTPQPGKRDYDAPVLKSLGKLSTVTLGVSPGGADSGGPENTHTP